MHPQTLQTLYFLDAQRLMELRHFQKFMEKHQHQCQNDLYEPIRRLAMIDTVRRSPGKPLTSFKISDILSADNSESSLPNSAKSNNVGTANFTRSLVDSTLSNENISSNTSADRRTSVRNTYNVIPIRTSPHSSNKIIRPWSRSPPLTSPSSEDSGEDSSHHSRHHITTPHRLYSPENNPAHSLNDEEFIDVENCEEDADEDTDSNSQFAAETDVSPLDALMAMSSKTFKGLDNFDKHRNGEHDQGKPNVPKKKRKTRTAFTNQQIYELEKRFILQKYLTPADRDEISAKLGLSCAQVITWFQNRRAKFKRDIEEMKNDVSAVSPNPNDNINEKDAT